MKKVLLIEDEIILALAVRALLESNNFVVCGIGNNLESCTALFQEHSPDIVITDFQLHGSAHNGLEIVDELQKTVNFPFVVLSAYDELTIEFDRTKYEQSYFLSKPYENEVLLSIIQKITLLAPEVK